MRTRGVAFGAVAALAAGTVGAIGGPAGAAADTTEIGVFIGFTDYRLDWLEDVAADFEGAHPDYEIVIRGFGSYEELLQAATLAVDQGEPPAIAQYFEVATQEARDSVTAEGEPLFASVEAAIDGRDEILGEPVVLGDIVQAVTDYYTIDGEFSSMPWNTSSTLMYGNESIMEAAGLDALPETWAEVEAACEAVMGTDDAPDACITWPNHGWFFEQSLGQQGGLLANEENGREARADEVYLDSPEMMAWVEYWNGLAEAGYYRYSGAQRDWEDTQNSLIDQSVAFILTSSGDGAALVADSGDAGFELAVGRMPYNDEVDYAGNLIGGATLWLINGLDEVEQDGALAFMQFINNPENAADWHRISNYIPITESAITLLEEEGWYDDNPWAAVATDQLAMADGSAASRGALLGGFVQIRDEMTGAMEDVLLGADPEERFAEAAEEAQRILEAYNELFAEEE